MHPTLGSSWDAEHRNLSVRVFQRPAERSAVNVTSKPSRDRSGVLFFGFFGAVSAVAVALTLAAIPIIAFHIEPRLFQTRLLWLAALVALPIGFLSGRNYAHSCEETEGDTLQRRAATAALALFHLGAMVVFAVTVVQAQRGFFGIFLGWSEFAFMRLENLVLAYAVLRIWTLLAHFFRFRFGVEPWFFIGLYIGTFPALLDAMMSIVDLRWISTLLVFPYLLFGFPGQLAEALYPNLIPHSLLGLQGIMVLVNSLTWGVLFFVVDLVTRVRRKND